MTLITLPSTTIKEMSNEYVKVEFLEEVIPKRKINKKVLEESRGLLKHLKLDPI